MGLGQLGHQFVERDLALGSDTGLDPAGHCGQLAMATAIALAPRRERSCFPPELDQIVDEFRRNPKVPRRFPVPVTFINESQNAFS